MLGKHLNYRYVHVMLGKHLNYRYVHVMLGKHLNYRYVAMSLERLPRVVLVKETAVGNTKQIHVRARAPA